MYFTPLTVSIQKNKQNRRLLSFKNNDLLRTYDKHLKKRLHIQEMFFKITLSSDKSKSNLTELLQVNNKTQIIQFSNRQRI